MIASLTLVLFLLLHSSQAFVPHHPGRVNNGLPISNVFIHRRSSSVTKKIVSTSGVSLRTSFFDGLFKQERNNVDKQIPKIPDFVVDSDYRLASVVALAGIAIVLLNPAKSCVDTDVAICSPSIFGTVVGGIHLLFGSFLAIQANLIRFVFDETCFELKRIGSLNRLNDSENIIVGGQNRWPYESFVNWEFFPNKNTPILVYFKETKTPPEKWSTGPGSIDKVGGGQVHFFPALANVKQLDEQFRLRGCAKIEK